MSLTDFYFIRLFVDDIKKSYNVLVNFVENVNEDVPTGNSAEDKDGEENLEHQQVNSEAQLKLIAQINY